MIYKYGPSSEQTLRPLRFCSRKRIIIRVVSLREQLFQTVRRLAGNILNGDTLTDVAIVVRMALRGINVPRKWIFPALPCRRFTKAHGARSQRVLSTGNRCTSPGETTVSAEDRRQPTAAAAAGRREPTQKNQAKIVKEIPL